MTRKRSRVVREGAERKGPGTEPRSPPTSSHGDGAIIVVGGVTTLQGKQESCLQGKGWQGLDGYRSEARLCAYAVTQ